MEFIYIIFLKMKCVTPIKYNIAGIMSPSIKKFKVNEQRNGFLMSRSHRDKRNNECEGKDVLK